MRMLKLIQENRAAKGCFLAALLVGVCIGEGFAGARSAIVLYQNPSTAKPQGGEQPPGESATPNPTRPASGGGVVPGPPPEQSRQRPPEGQKPGNPPQQQGQPSGRPTSSQQQPQTPPSNVVPAQQAPPPAQRPTSTRRGQKGPLSLKFDESSIRDVIEIVMEELGYSYIIDAQVTGSVSINMRGGVPRDQVFPILEQLLQMNGFAIVRQAESFYAIVPLAASPKLPQKILLNPGLLEKSEEETEQGKEEKKKPQGEQKKKKQGQNGGVEGQSAPPAEPPAGAASARAALPGAPPTPLTPQQPQQQQQQGQALQSLQSPQSAQIEGEEGVITYIIPLNFVPTSEFLKMAQVYMSDGATVVDFAPSNILMITDFRRNIQQVLKLVDLLDTRYFDINDIALIPIRFNNAADIAEDVGKIFAPNDTAAGVRIVAIERINAILVVTHGPEVLAEVRKWIDKLDSTSSGSNVKTYIYQVENNTADQIATILEQLYQDGFGLPSSAGGQDTGQDTQQGQQQPRRQQQAGFAPETQAERRRGGGGLGTLGPSLSQRPDAASGIRAVVSGNVKIIANDFNNSLIIQSTEADYQYLLSTIRQLDTLPRQVVIEAEIYSVLLTDSLEFGVMAFLEGLGNPDGGGARGPFPATTASSSEGIFSAVTRRAVGNSRQLRFQIQALAATTEVKILDAPRIMTMDGIQASINIGAEIPVQTSSFSDPVQGSTGFVNQISYRPTGSTLLIVPRVSASGIINLELSLEVSSSSGDSLTPTITRSFVETTLICRDGQSVAIGGIITENNSLSKKRIPVLGDIPIIGALFGTTSKVYTRTEIIFLITPSVVHSLPTAVELTLEFQRALRGSYDFIQKKRAERKELIDRRKAEELKPPGN